MDRLLSVMMTLLLSKVLLSRLFVETLVGIGVLLMLLSLLLLMLCNTASDDDEDDAEDAAGRRFDGCCAA